jgi:hypothetical protein
MTVGSVDESDLFSLCFGQNIAADKPIHEVMGKPYQL